MGVATRYPSGLMTDNRQYTDSNDNNFVTRTGFVKRDAVFKINFADGTTTYTTGLELPAGCIIDGYPVVNVRTAEVTGTTKTIQIGVVGTAGALVTGLSVASTGIIKPTMTFGAVTLGSLLLVDTASAANPTFEPYTVPAAIYVTWTPASANFAQLDADVMIPILYPVDLTQMPVNASITGIDSGN